MDQDGCGVPALHVVGHSRDDPRSPRAFIARLDFIPRLPYIGQDIRHSEVPVKRIRYGVILLGIVVASGCAGRRADVVIDPAGVDMGRYQQDLAQCQEIARQVRHKAVGGAVGGAVVGGAVGGIVGNGETAGKGAGAGAVVGAARGARATREEKQLVIKNCLRNRGYKVLN
jgi:outer membrane lipoprotein SlyB